ncbi:hypothetical protein FS837_009118 [Tulasnella sp. UAMH 9824]|nr:hypothetical protein FS837_009118 [Tulasnella sp. UAMH 9824]
MVLTIIGHPSSSCTRRVKTVLIEKGVEYTLKSLEWTVAEHKSEAHLKLQPFGQVPVLIDEDGYTLFESRAISRYIASKYADQGIKLLPDPSDAKAVALFEQAASIEQTSFDPYAYGIAVEKVFNPMKGIPTDEKRLKSLIDTLSLKLDGYERILSKQKYLAGDQELTIVDLWHLPYAEMSEKFASQVYEAHPKVNASESENEDLSEVDSQYGPSRDDDTSQDLEFLIEIGGEICTRLPHIWESIGAVWTHATDVLIGQDPEKFDENESDPGYEEDPSYKPIYRVQDIIKWLSTKESPRGSPEPTELERIIEKPTTVYSVALQDLPPELIVEIIQLALKDDPHAVITISHLNKAFRTLSLSIPGLWTEIDIMFHEERVSAHLERSGSSPLRVRASLSLLTMPGPSGATKLIDFIGAIKPYSSRISSLEMRYTNAMWSISTIASLERLTALSSLEEFDYGLLISRPPPRAMTAPFKLTCKPRRIRLSGVAIRAFGPLYSERVVSLQVAECWEGGVSDWAEALQSMPSLQKLEVSDFKIADPGPGENAGFGTMMPPISLPHLQTLSLTRVPRAVLMGLLEALQTPRLTSATIAFLEPDGLRGYYAPVPWLKPQPTDAGLSDASLLPFASANPQLQELDLQNCCMTSNMWTAVFGKLHHIEKLRIASSDVTTEALKCLVVSSGNPPALPRLTHLTLDNESLDKASGLSFPVIDALITTRWTRFYQQEADGESNGTQIQAMKSVVLRGWNEDHVPTPYNTITLARLQGLVEHLQLETFQATSEDGELTDEEWESQSEGSWASGDQAVVDLGDSLNSFEWGMDDDQEDNGGDVGDV